LKFYIKDINLYPIVVSDWNDQEMYIC
jgi:hypothetical protein